MALSPIELLTTELRKMIAGELELMRDVLALARTSSTMENSCSDHIRQAYRHVKLYDVYSRDWRSEVLLTTLMGDKHYRDLVESITIYEEAPDSALRRYKRDASDTYWRHFPEAFHEHLPGMWEVIQTAILEDSKLAASSDTGLELRAAKYRRRWLHALGNSVDANISLSILICPNLKQLRILPDESEYHDPFKWEYTKKALTCIQIYEGAKKSRPFSLLKQVPFTRQRDIALDGTTSSAT
ncbi:hypothetical protein M011DRAFT_473022 [Sporormia fimetaria CBS 119925]|uniref:Uncharacterized protein n=1 Tax=Sporormia fimetaria CBS 119925 TaxID=1340428 RepID=A0A6A6VR47_9PLEO|nr:hypothetical protein M011DRAFT_473022 [Sporormia fimetaria CBS 119925]